MTFSLVARCPRTGQVGVAACTGSMGVGKLVCYAQARIGAVATQAFINPYYGIDGLRLLSRGATAPDALREMRMNDPKASMRQVGIIDNESRVAAWTGQDCANWAGHMIAEHCCAQGNRLIGPETLEAALDAFFDNEACELAERLLLALEAGQMGGADRKGARSANVNVFDTEEYPLWDMRVDYARDPVKALRSVFRQYARELIPNIRKLPTRREPDGQLTEASRAWRDLVPEPTAASG